MPVLWCLVSGATLLAMGSPEAWVLLPAALLAVVASAWLESAVTVLRDLASLGYSPYLPESGEPPQRPGGSMRYQPMLLACTALVAVLGCGDGAVDPGDGGGGQEMAARFEQLADSVDGGGYSPTADALRHAAEIVRLTGGATPVKLTIDGQDRSFLAVAEQLDFPSLECTWPSDSGGVVPGDSGVGVPGDSGVVGPTPEPTPPDGRPGECTEVGTYSMRTLIAWEPENMAEVVRIVADLGSTEVQKGVPDVMTGLPTNEATGADGETPPDPGDSAAAAEGRLPRIHGRIPGARRGQLVGRGRLPDERAPGARRGHAPPIA